MFPHNPASCSRPLIQGTWRDDLKDAPQSRAQTCSLSHQEPVRPALARSGASQLEFGRLPDPDVSGLRTAQYLGNFRLRPSVTGFFLPPFDFDPPRAVGLFSLVLLAGAVTALYVFNLIRQWRWVYVVTVTMALYFNVFVGVIQAFQKLPFLQSLAPTPSP